MNQDLFNQTALVYSTAEKAMLMAKESRFPQHSVVMVNSPRYCGMGVVVVEDGCRPENLAVQIENGNVWHYLAMACEPHTNKKAWPKWLVKLKGKLSRVSKPVREIH